MLLVFGIKTTNAQSVSKISDGDKSKIIKSILSEEFPLKDAQTACISTENIPKSMLEQFPKISGVKFILAAPDKIGEFDCGLEYYFFDNFEKKRSSILVSFGNNYRNVSSAGRRYSYRKVKGKWRGKIVGFFLSRT
ncbi:MAG TPA: hypothetical protein VK308_07550 [Pyrinomonadaceae bacterium]|nr:hypothetical protein [Pyrinomonadaceae bacterium]